MSTRAKIAIAGATGFVGRALALELARDCLVFGLSRLPPDPDPYFPVVWRRCDLFSLLEVEKALEGIDHAFYLVHSMLPSAHLTQGTFQDRDLICADNFARAAAKAGVRQIIYLGGLIPGDPELSRHLRSRLEVEQTLGSRGVPVTALRAGIIIGPGGSSFRMLRALVERLPVIPCPRWARSLTQPIALDDVLRLLRHVLLHPARLNRHFDVGSPDVMSYAQMLKHTARILGLRRVFFDLPVAGTLWCRRWLAWVTGAPRSLVEPLLESMKHSMVCRDRRLQEEAGVSGAPFDAAVRATLARESMARRRGWTGAPADREFWKGLYRYDVRSVQRFTLPEGRSARWAAQQYSEFLHRRFRTFLRAEVDARSNVRFRLRWPSLSLLEHTFAHDRNGRPDRQVFYISGGLLAQRVARATGRPRLEFREVLGGTILLVAIHDYRPTLPWPVYSLTQAFLHLWVMRGFAAHLARAAGREEKT